MHSFNGIDWLRAFLLICTASTALYLAFLTFRARKVLSLGQFAWSLGATFALAYVADGLREAIQTHLEWRLRIVFLVCALVCYLIYISEPKARKWSRFGDRDPWRKR